ncbi:MULTISPECIES: DUF3592 domain-containing protein [Pseudomonas]|uniref:Uncharacterized protein n=1 Tax=Pseudomonas hunanensis TaxID=1247546 RepID=A0ACC6K5E4_9PSED|nr:MULTISPECIES: DUF3592 domain-containing protein [Pseudomonas]MBP2263264.1 hypothetical protein [Pseudomonas sp. BP8]MDR6713627.1 hypothetical protein [Pseudomonas hunanensis]HDS1735289.1 DUF3592 domain-containing protein [Pseudomonas putida]
MISRELSVKSRHIQLRTFFAVVGAVFFITAVLLHVQREAEKHGMVETIGTLIAFSYEDWGEGFRSRNKCPRIQFYTQANVLVTVEGKQCTTSSQNKIGDKVAVFYLPESPEHALLVVTADEWFYVVLSIGLGVMMWIFMLCTPVPGEKTEMSERGLIFSLAGIALVLGGVGYWVLQDHKDKQARMTEFTTGTVISGGSSKHCALIEFQAADQQSYDVSASVCSSGYDRGDRVAVRYDPANPRHAMLDTYWDGMFLPMIFFSISFIFVVTVLGLLPWGGPFTRDTFIDG